MSGALKSAELEIDLSDLSTEAARIPVMLGDCRRQYTKAKLKLARLEQEYTSAKASVLRAMGPSKPALAILETLLESDSHVRRTRATVDRARLVVENLDMRWQALKQRSYMLQALMGEIR